MWISNVKIKNFRNYKNEEIDLSEKINIFYGKNARQFFCVVWVNHIELVRIKN